MSSKNIVEELSNRIQQSLRTLGPELADDIGNAVDLQLQMVRRRTELENRVAYVAGLEQLLEGLRVQAIQATTPGVQAVLEEAIMSTQAALESTIGRPLESLRIAAPSAARPAITDKRKKGKAS